jgi:hypothetical protein
VSSLATGQRLEAFGNVDVFDTGSRDPILSAWFSQDASTLYTVDMFSSFEARRTTDWVLTKKISLGGGGYPWRRSGEADPVHGLLALPSQYGRVFRMPSGELLGDLETESNARIDADPGGRFLITTDDRTLRVFGAERLDLRLVRIEYERGEWLGFTPDLHYIGSPQAEEWAFGQVGNCQEKKALHPSGRNSAAVRRALSKP